MPHTADVVVVGAGAIGCAIARRLAKARRRVIVLDRGQPGREASSAAAGLLCAQGEGHEGPFLDLCLRSRAQFPALVEELEAETGMDVGYSACGILEVALSEDEDRRLAARAAEQAARRLSVERLDGASVRRLEPGLSPSARGGLLFAEEAAVDTGRFALALARAAAAAGALLLPETPVARILAEGERIQGVRLASGEEIHAEVVVNAAGAWAGFGGDLPIPLPVRPAKGQMLALEAPPLAFRRPVLGAKTYLVPRPEGRLLVGATVEDAGFDKSVTAEGALSLLAGAIAIAPGLRGARLVETWAGLRPRTPDGWPVLGEAGVPGLYAAAGHFRNGILLAPVTAEILAGLILEGRSPVSIGAFRADRFAARAAGGA